MASQAKGMGDRAVTDYHKRYYQEHKEEIRVKGRERYKDPTFRERRKKRARDYGQELKVEILSYYSNNDEPKCLICGEIRVPCLSIDHIYGGGTAERKKNWVIGGGSRFYLWLKKQGYPSGYQTLCMNCQWYKRWVNKEN